jgi:orotate phosphoribosyltransferase
VSSAELLIKHALAIGALELLPEGRTLKSGRISPYFFNSGLFTTGTSLNILGDAFAESFKENWGMLKHPTVIFGPAYKGISLAALAVSSLGQSSDPEQQQVQYAHDRKEEKQHGEGGRIVGASLKGQRVVIVDDVITTGGTKDEAVELITKHGGTVTGLVVLFDRQERSVDGTLSAAQEFSEKHSVPVVPVASLLYLIEYIRLHAAGSNETRNVVEAICAYRDTYGAM